MELKEAREVLATLDEHFETARLAPLFGRTVEALRAALAEVDQLTAERARREIVIGNLKFNLAQAERRLAIFVP